jgi:hypothetical protein
MRLAWFRATRPDSGALLDRTASLIDALRGTHAIDVITAAEAHDFVWKHGRQPYDLCIYEVSAAHQFVTPYLLHYPGVAFVTDLTSLDPRTCDGSRLVVVPDDETARVLACEWPAARVRLVPTGVEDRHVGPRAIVEGQELVVATMDPARRAVVERAVQRARNAGVRVHLSPVPDEADVIIALEWPPTSGPPLAAVRAVASGRPAIVLEVEVTAGWPALDPQTGLPRGFSADPPIVISIDPRDEEHSLMLALARLAANPSLRTTLAAAARTWWHAHATFDQTVAVWEAILSEAATLDAAASQQVADGTERARKILAEVGVAVDFL